MLGEYVTPAGDVEYDSAPVGIFLLMDHGVGHVALQADRTIGRIVTSRRIWSQSAAARKPGAVTGAALVLLHSWRRSRSSARTID